MGLDLLPKYELGIVIEERLAPSLGHFVAGTAVEVVL
jgi:hypothetical protein